MREKSFVMGRGTIALTLLPDTSQQSWVAVWRDGRKLHSRKGCRRRFLALHAHGLQEKHSYLLAFPLGDANSTLPLALLNCTIHTLVFTLFLLEQMPTEKQGRALLEDGLHNGLRGWDLNKALQTSLVRPSWKTPNHGRVTH